MTEFFVFNFLPIMLVEGLILWATRWGKIWTCMLDSLMMNFASVLCLMLGIAPAIINYRIAGMLLYFTYSFLVEAFVLCLLERHTIKQAVYAAAVSNLGSVLYLAIYAQFVRG